LGNWAKSFSAWAASFVKPSADNKMSVVNFVFSFLEGRISISEEAFESIDGKERKGSKDVKATLIVQQEILK
jgi:hypothetical protein